VVGTAGRQPSEVPDLVPNGPATRTGAGDGAPRRAAERTARAEASLVETEQKIHQTADEVRGELKNP
jgi:hypothetical protein